jgi:CRP-like cAMP-binding protein
VQRLTPERCHAKTTLVRQGDDPAKMYIVGSGEARVLLRIDGGDGEASVLQIATLGPGSLFGEIGVLHDKPHTASVVSLSDMTLYSIPRSELLACVKNRSLGTLLALLAPCKPLARPCPMLALPTSC